MFHMNRQLIYFVVFLKKKQTIRFGSGCLHFMINDGLICERDVSVRLWQSLVCFEAISDWFLWNVLEIELKIPWHLRLSLISLFFPLGCIDTDINYGHSFSFIRSYLLFRLSKSNTYAARRISYRWLMHTLDRFVHRPPSVDDDDGRRSMVWLIDGDKQFMNGKWLSLFINKIWSFFFGRNAVGACTAQVEF